MKSVTKKFALAGLSAACAVTLGAGVLVMNNDIAQADTNTYAPNASTYFYDSLLDENGNEYILAKKFYEALEKMNEEGDFLDGVVDYSLDGIVSSNDLKGWVEDGKLDVPKAFSAARDSFLTDHPEIFYIDFYKLTISVAKSGGNYVGFINSGREANLYYDNGLRTASAVSAAVEKFEDRIDEIVKIVTEQEETNNLYLASDVYLAKEVNAYLAENISYDYAAYEGKDDANYVAAAYINTPYGGLVEGKAVCGGFSTSYKVIMDKLGIPCITVNGYSNNKDEYGSTTESSVYHMWNYVWLANPAATQSKARAVSYGEWYSFDVTWDSADYNRYRYTAMNASVDAGYHVNDGVISSSGYELVYPELSVFNYGSTGETDGLQVSLTYEETGEKDDYNNDLVSTFVIASYNGKGANRLLEEDGLFLAKREASYEENEDGEMELVWTSWSSLEYWIRALKEYNGDLDYGEIYQDTGTETRYYDNTSVYSIQLAVFDVAPDRDSANGTPSWGFDPETDPYRFFYYSNDLVENSTMVAISEAKINESYGTYTPSPYILEATPSQTVFLTISDSMAASGSSYVAESKAFTMEITYDQPLHILDESQPIGISFVSAHPNAQEYAKFYPINSNGDLVELVEGTINFTTGEKALNTLRFKFAPSLMYEHDSEGYNIFFTNVGSAKQVALPGGGFTTSDKQPMPAFYCCGRMAGVCSKRFNYDGRLYIECCAQPTLIADSDLSEMNFVDETGADIFSDDSRKQLMLVAERADDATVDDMLDRISDSDEININKDDIKASETFEIQLTLCQKFAQIKDGSYIKISLGFPEGYGPEDEGVTFKLYHRKHISGDEYIIEEIPCVVTKFGIVATVTSFSPYMVVAVDADKATDKTIYASVEGKGGTLALEDGQIRSLKEGESYTYTIQPDDGYQVYSATLNGVSIMNRIADGKLTIGYNDLDMNSQLVIQYIANEAAARIQQKIDNNIIEENVEVGKYVIGVDGTVTANTSMPTFSVTPDNFLTISTGTDNGNNGPSAAVIAIAVVTCVIAAAALAALVVVIVRRKKD